MADAVDESIVGSVIRQDYGTKYFWHEKSWSTLTRDFSKLPHALLINGCEGVGKTALAWRLSKSLLCEAPTADATACGTCPSCVRFRAGTHPDFLSVAPLGESIVISVDQIREVGQFCTLTPHTALRKVVVIDPAEMMNTSAANAFLKVLEEPPKSCYLLLASARPSRLPATIRSRCVSVPLLPPGRDEAVRWLQSLNVDAETADAALALAGGAPARAFQLTQTSELHDHEKWTNDIFAMQLGKRDPLSCAREWKEYGAERCLGWLQRYIAERAAETIAEIENTEKRIFLRELFYYFDVISDARNLATGPLDQALLLEDASIRLSRLFRRVV